MPQTVLIPYHVSLIPLEKERIMKKRILIVDDEERIRKVYKRFLYAVSIKLYDVTDTADAEEATECLIRHQFDLVILDLRMAGVDGRELFAIIKECNPQQKVIVASVYPIDRQRRMVPAADDYFDKADGPIRLLEAVTRNMA